MPGRTGASKVSKKSSSSSGDGISPEPSTQAPVQSTGSAPQYNLSNTTQIEHSVIKFLEMLKRLEELSPTLDTYQELLKDTNKLDIQVIPPLSRYMLKFAAELKTLQLLGKTPNFEEIKNYESQFKPFDPEPIFSEISKSDIKKIKQVSKKCKSNVEDNKDMGTENKRKAGTAGSWPPPLPEIKNPAIRARVFLHKSVIKDKVFLDEQHKIESHNERLEFLGDSVMNFVVTKIIYKRFPSYDDGQLTILRQKLINNNQIREFSELYGLSNMLRSNINLFGKFSDYQTGKKKVEADVFESYIGGLVEDDPENHLETVYRWLDVLMGPTIERVTKRQISLQENDSTNFDAKRELYSLIGYAALGLKYKTVRHATPTDSTVTVQCVVGDGTVLGAGTGKNIKVAGARAAENVLQNKELVEKYANLRAAIPRDQSAVKNTEHPAKRTQDKQQLDDASGKKGKISVDSNGQFIMS
ncbi:ribonuclease III KNAG_0J00680 [Huiozyma naganishii CBS 8797]|uniref:ribonuclease III n=1 Tax=Huiozyma naganishii (strain ATCC MYA-139 / BCRC 22969 / CBS 8797 / KCTC 17520 / NBRC 10181 / NCYC 3082 / Yp74L-3) TaxID=1071383 RepID=J7SAG7_HUIN7|nr:hypothetical protein KNAG_0J00680 [Kazachstania naganishii CBS 8797]CCK72151.1 hypothetical protein KNAG_0J00680 [Kazachstania naganishii CBS 8797]